MELIIAGFHRSGTSLTSNILHNTGLMLGDEMLGKDSSNPNGHFEDVEVVKLHEKLLRANGENWQVSERNFFNYPKELDKEFSNFIEKRQLGHELWGFKDPRVCLFLDYWESKLTDMKVIVVLRHYSDCCDSLMRRHSKQYFENKGPKGMHLNFWNVPDKALKMWCVHNEAILRFARVFPEKVVVFKHESICSGQNFIKIINEKFKVKLKEISPLTVFDPSYMKINNRPIYVKDENIGKRADEVYSELLDLVV
jgi:hypothetical protein